MTGTTPAAGALVQPPTDIIVTFNDPVLGTSLTPGELEVNGVAATAVTLVNANTVDWSVPASAFATGVDLPNVVTIGADAYGDQVTDVSGQTLTPYSYTFFTTNVRARDRQLVDRRPGVLAGPGRCDRGRHLQPADGHVVHHVVELQPLGQLSQRLLCGRVV